MGNRDAVAKIPFQEYAGLYLKYMSYLNNKFHVTAEARERAARVYYSCFVANTVPDGLMGRQLVEATIRHLLE